MMWLNEYDIMNAVRETGDGSTPNLHCAALTLNNLMEWTNDNSDGWPYWAAPGKAAKRLQEALYQASMSRYAEDITAADLKRLQTPIKSFLTRQGVSASAVIVAAR